MLNGGGAVVCARVLDAGAAVAGRCEEQGEECAPRGSASPCSGSDSEASSQSAAAWRGREAAAPRLAVAMAVRGRGSLVCYCSRLPSSCNVDGFEVPFALEGHKLVVEVPQARRGQPGAARCVRRHGSQRMAGGCAALHVASDWL